MAKFFEGGRLPKFTSSHPSFLLAVKDCYLDKIIGAKDTDFLQKEITSRYNITIAVPPQSPQAVSPG